MYASKQTAPTNHLKLQSELNPMPASATHTGTIKMKLGKTATTALVMSAVLIVLTGCQKKEEPADQAAYENKVEIRVEESSAEHVGRDVDEAAAKVGEKIEEVGEKIQDAVKDDKH